MRGLLKFTFLASAFCLNLFSIDFSKITAWEYTNSANSHFFPESGFLSYPKQDFIKTDAQFIGGKFVKISNDIYTHNGISDTVFNSEFADDSGYFLQNDISNSKLLVFYESSFEKYQYTCFFSKDSQTYNGCSDDYPLDQPGYKKVDFTYYSFTTITKVATCQPDEHFNTNTKQCQKCKENESWDPETNTCFNDCRKDGKINKFAFTDGSCIDCSGEKDSLSVLQCICRGYGNSSIDPKIWGKNGGSPDGCQLEGSCGDGSIQHSFTNPNCKPDDNPDPKPDPKPDNNTTKPDNPDNPDPGGGGGGGDNSGGGNNGGSQDNQNPNPGSGDADEKFCKEHPKDPKCKPKPKPDNNNTTPGGGGGGGGGFGGDGVEFKESDFNYDELKKSINDFKGKYENAVNDTMRGFDNFRQGLDQFIENVKGKGLNDISKKSMPKSCSHKETIDFFGYNVVMDFDFCKVVAPASDAFYYLFYVFFFGCFLVLIIKLLIFSF